MIMPGMRGFRIAYGGLTSGLPFLAHVQAELTQELSCLLA